MTKGLLIVDSDSSRDSDGQQGARARALLQVPPDGPADIGSQLDRLCSVAANELQALGAVVTLMTTEGSEAEAAASHEEVRRLEAIQFGVGEGPGRAAFATGRPVLVPDLQTAFARWPGYVTAAGRAGVGAVYAFPLQLGAVRFGVLTFYAAGARTLTEPETTQCLVFAELATERLLDSSPDGTTDTADPGLLDALHFRDEVYQAQGMVMEQLGVSLAEALSRMRAHAFTTDQDLTALAVGILARATLLPVDDE